MIQRTSAAGSVVDEWRGTAGTHGARAVPRQALALGLLLGLVLVAAPLRPARAGGARGRRGRAARQGELPAGRRPGRLAHERPDLRAGALRAVYPGVDLVYYGDARQLEYDFLVAPGADPGQIALRFDGADAVAVDA